MNSTATELTKLDAFVEDLGLELRNASRVGSQRFANVPGNFADEIRVYNWPHEKSGARYDRDVVVLVFDDESFTCALKCEMHNVVGQRDELERLVGAK